ncbi:hypothetical protein I602_796 [Polaribacter dokdonensis DSW-5]|uniref:Uncharacterized protein n=1 Tax=Polaribacter dokdonensis DSW-5 TaxID=1300348 RepID=A0A0M9CFB4_9FLAO|nr:hypothetical protein I602_796 [Polaribacter dokdonensis DSW-5]SEE15822.1 hypothetical protein SAMN05444353_0982 [Polaribacter dokdonensis DSW-5]
MELSDDGMFIKEFGVILHYITLFIAVFYYSKYKEYSFYKYFLFYFLVIVIVDLLNNYFYTEGNNINLYNIYTFFEFNAIVLIYYHLIQQKTRLIIVKALAIAFNLVYILSFIFDYYILYTIPLEGVVNSIFVILYLVELLNSDGILNYKKMFPFWMSVSFLIFYLTSVPFWSLYYSSIFNTRAMFPIIYYLGTSYQLIFIYGLITCKKMGKLY